MNRVFLVGGLRSHIGIRNGIFKHIRPEVLGGRVVRTLCQRYGIQGPDALICGNAVGPGGNIGRLLLLEGGLPERVPAFTIDLQCASGLAAIHMAALSIMAGEWDVVQKVHPFSPRGDTQTMMKEAALEILSSRRPSSGPANLVMTP